MRSLGANSLYIWLCAYTPSIQLVLVFDGLIKAVGVAVIC